MILPRLLQAGWLLSSLTSLSSSTLVSNATTLPPHVKFAEKVKNPEEELIKLSYGLALQNLDKLEPLLRGVSDPESINYGSYLSKDEISRIFGPEEISYSAVMGWLKENGVEEMAVSDDGLSIDFVTTVSNANEMLRADFNWYDVNGQRKLRTREYSILDDISQYVEVVTPTNYFGPARRTRPFAADAVGFDEEEPPLKLRRKDEDPIEVLDRVCPRLITPPCISEMYGIHPQYKADSEMDSRVGFASFLGQSAVASDLDKFVSMFNLPRPQKFESIEINGGEDHQNFRLGVGEGNLDAQMLALGAQDLPITHYVVGGRAPFVPNVRVSDENNDNEPYLEFYSYLMSKENNEIPQVISLSYSDDEQTVPFDYATRTCNLMGLMGLRGASILEASGDGGVGGACKANDGSDRVEFTPQFPPSCPYVTGVGGTMGYKPEKAWWGSSGGFSNYFPRPWYQDQHVGQYLSEGIDAEKKDEYRKYANYTGRGCPDMAAHSMLPNYQIIVGGASTFSGGTSAAAPLVAGLIGMINAERLRKGKPTMGFLNPFLYSLRGTEALTDIVEGASKGCDGYDTQSGMPIDGAGVIGNGTGAHWEAVEGWDPATGLGTPHFSYLLQAAMKLPRINEPFQKRRAR